MGGMLIGANGLYCAVYAGIGVATALELKDSMWGVTVGGVAIGFGVRMIIKLM